MSIRAAYNSGIIDYAINGTKKYQEEATKEDSIISETEGFMASVMKKVDGLENEDGGNDEDNTVPDLLRKYVLGADGEGRDIFDILSEIYEPVFVDDQDSITDASTSIIFLNNLFFNIGSRNYYIKYNDVAYKIVVEYGYDSENEKDIFTTVDVLKVYEPNGMEGQIVQYKANEADSNATDWLVLYDNGETVDITPLVLSSNWNYTLGYNDPGALAALPSGSELDRAMWSYNHATDSLNAYCETIVTNILSENGEMVRSIGTVFGQTDTNKLSNSSNLYSSTFLANNPEGEEGAYNGVGLKGDMDAEQDVVRMSYFSEGNNYETFGYAKTSLTYWLPSRNVDYCDGSVRCYFGLRRVYDYRACG